MTMTTLHPSHTSRKLEKRLRREVGRAIQDYNMIEEGDRVMVCISGGKDSFSLLDILCRLKIRAPIDFQLTAVNVDQNQPGFPTERLKVYLQGLGVDYRIIDQDTYSVVKNIIPDGKTMCGLCSRLRRGILYSFAKSQGMTKIALGHHRDDIVETLFLNMFFGGRLKAMPPKLLSDDGNNVVIRPLSYCSEKDIAQYAQLKKFPIIPCNLCGSQPNLQRQTVKRMLAEWEQKYPGRSATIFRSVTSISPSQLADPSLFDFARLGAHHEPATWLPEGSTIDIENAKL